MSNVTVPEYYTYLYPIVGSKDDAFLETPTDTHVIAIISCVLCGVFVVMMIAAHFNAHMKVVSYKRRSCIWRRSKGVPLGRYPRKADSIFSLMYCLVMLPLLQTFCVWRAHRSVLATTHVLFAWVLVLASSSLCAFLSMSWISRKMYYLQTATTLHFSYSFIFLFEGTLRHTVSGGEVIVSIVTVIILGLHTFFPPLSLRQNTVVSIGHVEKKTGMDRQRGIFEIGDDSDATEEIQELNTEDVQFVVFSGEKREEANGVLDGEGANSSNYARYHAKAASEKEDYDGVEDEFGCKDGDEDDEEDYVSWRECGDDTNSYMDMEGSPASGSFIAYPKNRSRFSSLGRKMNRMTATVRKKFGSRALDPDSMVLIRNDLEPGEVEFGTDLPTSPRVVHSAVELRHKRSSRRRNMATLNEADEVFGIIADVVMSDSEESIGIPKSVTRRRKRYNTKNNNNTISREFSDSFMEQYKSYHPMKGAVEEPVKVEVKSPRFPTAPAATDNFNGVTTHSDVIAELKMKSSQANFKPSTPRNPRGVSPREVPIANSFKNRLALRNQGLHERAKVKEEIEMQNMNPNDIKASENYAVLPVDASGKQITIESRNNDNEIEYSTLPITSPTNTPTNTYVSIPSTVATPTNSYGELNKLPMKAPYNDFPAASADETNPNGPPPPLPIRLPKEYVEGYKETESGDEVLEVEFLE